VHAQSSMNGTKGLKGWTETLQRIDVDKMLCKASGGKSTPPTVSDSIIR
jgi:hypothetical protein